MVPVPAHAEHFAPTWTLDVGMAVGPWSTAVPDSGQALVAGMVSARRFKRFGKFRGGSWDSRTALELGAQIVLGGLIADNGLDKTTDPDHTTNAGFILRGTGTVRLWSRWQGIGAFVRIADDNVPVASANPAANVVIEEQTTTGGLVMSVGSHHWNFPALLMASFKWEPLPDMRLDRFSIELTWSFILGLGLEYRRFGLEEGLVRDGHELMVTFGVGIGSAVKINRWERRNKKK